MTDEYIEMAGRKFRKCKPGEPGPLRDGEFFSASMLFMDATQRAIAQPSTLTDGLGRPAGQRPGFVRSTDPAVISAQQVNDAARTTRLAIQAGLPPSGLRGRDLMIARLTRTHR